MSLFLLFLVVLAGVCFSTIFLMEQPDSLMEQPDSPAPSSISKTNKVTAPKNDSLDTSLPAKIPTPGFKMSDSRTSVG